MIPPGWWMIRRNQFQHRLARVLMVCPFGLFAAGAPAASDPLAVEPLPAASMASLQDQVTRPHMVADPAWFNWGCSVIRGDDGAYHMFYARWPKALTFTAWLPHSEIVHAVADQPEGPYRMLDLAMPSHGPGRGEWFTAHNPKIKRFEGRYYLYFIQTRGNTDAARREEISRTGYSHPQWKELRENQRTFVAVSDSLNGPWIVTSDPIVEPAKTITTLTVNPAVCRGPDGTYFMIVKGDKPGETRFVRNQALATAPTPSGPWTIHPKPVIDDLDTEDCSMWYDATSHRFFAVYHAHTYIGWMSSPNGYDWERMPEPLTRKTLRFTDGSHDDPQRMERPFVLTDEQGLPRMLFVACRRGNTTLNVALPLRIHNQH